MQLLDAPAVMALLEEYSFNLVLHGHKHVPHITTQIRTDSGTLTIIGAGTATCPYLEEQATFGNNLNVIEIDPDANRGTVQRLKANQSGAFIPEMDPKPFSLFRISREGYTIRRFRKLVAIDKDGTTTTTVAREHMVVDPGIEMRTLPLKIVASTPGAKIQDFSLETVLGTVQWVVDEENMYDGELVFHQPLTDKDDPATFTYRYRIESGSAMSADELLKRYLGNVKLMEESTSITVKGFMQAIELRVAFPVDYPSKADVRIEHLGSIVPAGKYRYDLHHDAAANTWKSSK